MKFFSQISNLLNKKQQIISYESNISFCSNYKNYKNVVIKKYKIDCGCIQWLNKHLKTFYQFSSIMPVAQHEFRALEILYENKLSPKPLELGVDYIVLEKYGQELKNFDKSMYLQAENILKTLKELDFKHNDLLMRNILIGKQNQLKLIDFTLSEFNGIEIIKYLPDKNWAYPGDERILTYFK